MANTAQPTIRLNPPTGATAPNTPTPSSASRYRLPQKITVPTAINTAARVTTPELPDLRGHSQPREGYTVVHLESDGGLQCVQRVGIYATFQHMSACCSDGHSQSSERGSHTEPQSPVAFGVAGRRLCQSGRQCFTLTLALSLKGEVTSDSVLSRLW